MSSILDIPTPWAVLALLNQRRRPTLAGHCARPRCEHPASHHVVIGGCNIDTERGLCPCPAFRTEAQQEAWEALAKVNQQHHFPPWTVIERLLELYP